MLPRWRQKSPRGSQNVHVSAHITFVAVPVAKVSHKAKSVVRAEKYYQGYVCNNGAMNTIYAR